MNHSRSRSAARALGLWAEEYVFGEISKRGHRFLGRRMPVFAGGKQAGEIDLIYLEGRGVLVFVEVRARRRRTHGGPESSIDYQKRRRMSLAVRVYWASLSEAQKREICEIRIDVWLWDATMGWREIQGDGGTENTTKA
jgi:Holliday junction resolvase-like predicted endonuclease